MHARRVAAIVAAGGWLWLAALVVAGLLGMPSSRPAFEAAGLTFGVGLFAVAAVLALSLNPQITEWTGDRRVGAPLSGDDGRVTLRSFRLLGGSS